MTASAGQPTGDVIAARATVTLDAHALDELGPATIDRLADLVAKRLDERRVTGEAPLLTVAEAAQLAGLHPETDRRAIRSGALKAAGHVGKRPRLRRDDVERWLDAAGDSARATPTRPARPLARSSRRRVRGDALTAALGDGARS